MAVKEAEIAAAEFIGWYSSNQKAHEEIAASLAAHLTRVLAEANLGSLMVSARAKSVDSVIGKLLRRPYRRPRSQLTDRIGARVIVYHGSDVDRVAEALRRVLVVRERDSVDKRSALGLREFGYRSYHLVASLPQQAFVSPALWPLRNQVFEIQVRSLLEHIWAEIEHDVVYKSCADWPTELKRRFASMAGVLELLEHEFQQMSQTAIELVTSAKASMEVSVVLATNLDVPHMLGYLEITRPRGLSFRTAASRGTPFPPGIEQRLNLALRRSGVTTVGALRRVIRSRRFRSCLRRYARAEGIAGDEASHLAMLALLVGLRSRRMLTTFFPEFAEDASVSVSLSR